MLYLIAGFIAGAASALFLFFPAPCPEILPEWWGGIAAIDGIEKSLHVKPDRAEFFVRIGDTGYHILKGNGETAVAGTVEGGLAAFSGNGRFHVKYQKVGDYVEFFNAAGERFWKIDSMEYPYLSHNGKLIFLMNGDHSGIRIADYNGQVLGGGISGRTCTALAFSDRNDFGGAGFLDGTYHIADASGKILHGGRAPDGNMVKGIAISGNGRYAAVHYGGNRKDRIRVINTESGSYDDAGLSHVHHSKTSLHVNDEGFCVILDSDRMLRISRSGRVKVSIDVPAKRQGHSSVRFNGGVYAVTYTMSNGVSALILFREDGTVLFSNEYPSESFLDASLGGGLLLLRGSDNLFCYSLGRVAR
ncbi:MAG: hypothetical protein E4G96_05485 [Chrysiogenales bacterium]|nr:MAG: hypothetical protein E4G96_05485 [Chrysiogenales bacterium]